MTRLTHAQVRALRDATAARASCVTCEALLMPDRASAPHCEGCTVSDEAEAEWEQRGFADCDHADIIRAICEEWLARRRLTWAGGCLLGATLFHEISERWEAAGTIAEYGQRAITGRDWLARRDSGSTWIATFAPNAVHPHVESFDSEVKAREWLEGLAIAAGYEVTT